MAGARAKGIFCLEGDWEADLRSLMSMGPVLELLEKANEPPVRSIRRGIGTVPEFEYYLGKWTQKRYQAYPILYLGFHGSPGILYLGHGKRRTEINLDWLEGQLEGKCRRRIIHFGSCGTLAAHGNRLRRFFQRTGALAVCGYKVEVDGVLSAAFEIVLLSGFQQNTLTRQGMAAVKRRVQSEARGLAKALQFRMVIAP